MTAGRERASMFKRLALLKAAPFRVGCLVILLSCLSYYYIARTGNALLLSLDAEVFNAMFRSRGEIQTTGQIVIVDIDEKSLQKMGQ
jgi:CHASE2 domain-containing sensor protein